MIKTHAAVVVNNRGEILPWTAHSTQEQVKETIIEKYGEDIWNAWTRIGCKVIACQIVVELE